MQIDKRYKLDQFIDEVKAFDFGSIPPNEIVLHHTYIPTLDQWNGKASYEGIKNYWKRKGWNAYPHIVVAPDGIWYASDLYEPGIHSGKGNATYTLPDGKEVKGYGWKYNSTARLKSYSIGIEVVGNYDKKRWPPHMKNKVLGVVSALRNALGISDDQLNESITFHRDYSSKSCPGAAITKDWVLQQLEIYENDSTDSPKPSPYAKEAWEWAREEGLDLSLHPNQTLSAESVISLIYKTFNKLNK